MHKPRANAKFTQRAGLYFPVRLPLIRMAHGQSLNSVHLEIILASCGVVHAQDLGTLEPKPLPPIEHPDANTPAKELFGREDHAGGHDRAGSIGYYTNGCLAGGTWHYRSTARPGR